MSSEVLATAHGLGGAAEKVGVVVVAALMAIFVLAEALRLGRRLRSGALIGVLVLTPLLLLVDIWDSSQVVHLRHHPAIALLAAAAGLIVVAGIAWLIIRRPQILPVMALLALPFRIPISVGGGTANLLVPLYLVVAGGAVAFLLGAYRSGPRHAPDGSIDSGGPRLGSPRTLMFLLMGYVLVYAVQSIYSPAFSTGLENIVFFYVPFAVLFGLLLEVEWTRELLLFCLAAIALLAVLFAGIGFVEYARKSLFLNPKVVAANQYDNYFRVNSLFFDPNIYGRFLALVMIAMTTAVLWSTQRRAVVLGAAVLAWLLAGLITSFSQSSIAALLVGLAVLAAWRWDLRATIYVVGGLLAVAAVVVALAPPSLHLGFAGKDGSAANATSGRTKLISGGLGLFADRPLQGFGSGSFAPEYRQHERVSAGSATSASHTIPVTVAAEQGLAGLALYLALLLSGFIVLFSSAGRDTARIALAACFAALVLHTFAYADFLEDPATWVILGMGVALAYAGPQSRLRQAENDPVALAVGSVP